MAKQNLELKLSKAFDGIYDSAGGKNTFKMLIGGHWRTSERGKAFDIHTPIDGSIIAGAQLATRRDRKSVV